ncbi:hypothetical protein BS50DRAFT_296138 [Corynespora cassiicola Philippines]|uniref:Uncharacterized protein n=1 Tax=Corynespora cassiicola Philippines TaxID=1448308 RepID=A0A2T2NXG4_CORCC|nr:hypothetical protein BS50DRAFT_296138 [Corynespora cassiicola Philippines]
MLHRPSSHAARVIAKIEDPRLLVRQRPPVWPAWPFQPARWPLLCLAAAGSLNRGRSAGPAKLAHTQLLHQILMNSAQPYSEICGVNSLINNQPTQYCGDSRKRNHPFLTQAVGAVASETKATIRYFCIRPKETRNPPKRL